MPETIPDTTPDGALPPDPSAPDLAGIEIAAVLGALADPVRLEIVRQVAGCPEADGVVCGQIEIPVSKSTASHHLKILHKAGITAERPQGTAKFIRLRHDELERRFPGLIDSVLRSS